MSENQSQNSSSDMSGQFNPASSNSSSTSYNTSENRSNNNSYVNSNSYRKRNKNNYRKPNNYNRSGGNNFNNNKFNEAFMPSKSIVKFQNIVGENCAQREYNKVLNDTGQLALRSDQPVNLILTILFDKKSLIQQAEVFSRQFLQFGNVRFNYLLGRDERKWINQLSETFIYSYFKAFTLGTEYSDVSTRFGDSYLFNGHQILFDVLKQRTFTFEYTPGIYVNYIIELSPFQVESIRNQMLTQFPFLRNTVVDQPGIGYNVIDAKYENILASISDHKIYPQNVTVSKMERNVSRTEFLKGDVLPLGNSLVSSDLSGQYYSFKPLQNISDDSYSWGRACGITSTDVTTIENYQYISYVNPGVYAKYNARAITGLNIRFEPTDMFEKTLVLPITKDEGPDDGKDEEIVIPPVGESIIDFVKNQISLDGDSISETDNDLSVAISGAAELMNKIGVQLNLDKLVVGANIIPFDIDAKMDFINTLSPTTILQFAGNLLNLGLRFKMNNYKIDKSGVYTIDNSIHVTFDKTTKGMALPFKDILEIATAAWFAKNQKIIGLEVLKNHVSGRYSVRNVYYKITKNYHITVFGNPSFVTSVTPNDLKDIPKQ